MIGKMVYGEWLVPVVDYYSILKSNERNYEIMIPLVVSLITIISYHFWGDTLRALLKLRDILPNALAILIGFTVSCITILVTSNSDSVKIMKETNTKDRYIRNSLISIFQWLFTNFVYILIIQVFLLAFIFFVSFILQFFKNSLVLHLALMIEVFLLLHILLLIIRNITNFYFIFFVNKL
ncbi:hypothetical protein ACFQ88_23405 [Paenibacillus sp. NPDC056579]|uniref:hypothetical protein n=1 Tax=Paenibacillus sp. NPDC056579 TaxID=3345871 RepID=UPI00367CD6DD